MCSLRIIIVLYVLVCTQCFGIVDSLNVNDDGVCLVRTSFQKTRWKTFYVQTKKMCGKKRCVIKKNRREPFTATKSQTVCCNGWQYKGEDDKCVPFCSTGCFGGHCVQPDTCHCNPPAFLDEEHKNTCISPTCEPTCVNGGCVANNTCKCNNGYKPYNSTHCYHCDPGYVISEDLSCSPHCDQPCVNGQCIGPNVCGCYAGFRSKDAFTCEPVCDNPCVNSMCTAPNVCTCLEGYIKVSGSCVPYCDSCSNGRCVRPNVCDCNEGYEKVNGSCVPKCENACINAVCSEPGVCTCNEGYEMDVSGFKCTKPCDTDCPNDCDDHGKCFDCSRPIRLFAGSMVTCRPWIL